MKWLLVVVVLGSVLLPSAEAQIVMDTITFTPRGDTVRFWASIPLGYNPQFPPAIIVGWHGIGSNHLEFPAYGFDEEANRRGWIAASHRGDTTVHWNHIGAQEHCRLMLDWIMRYYPFSRDSIYMVGGSMGGAGPQVWHVNNCGSEDYLLAAAAGGSQILDCQLRAEQFLQRVPLDTNRSMRYMFGGLPCSRDSAAFQYHRSSAIHFIDTCDADPAIWDTAESMHYNALHLPVWNSWGNDSAEWVAYGEPAVRWDSIRRAQGADTTVTQQFYTSGHGYSVLLPDTICQWLSGFSANRYPNWIQINADEDGDYYWTRVTLAHEDTTFGRYGCTKDPELRLLHIKLTRNVRVLEVRFTFPWSAWDSLVGRWENFDRNVRDIVIRLWHVPPVLSVRGPAGPVPFTYADSVLTVPLNASGQHVVVFAPSDTGNEPVALPRQLRITSAYPNPFNSQLTFMIDSPKPGHETITFYDVTGRVAKVIPVELAAGSHRISVSAAGLSSGIYFASLSGSPAKPAKLVLLR